MDGPNHPVPKVAGQATPAGLRPSGSAAHSAVEGLWGVVENLLMGLQEWRIVVYGEPHSEYDWAPGEKVYTVLGRDGNGFYVYHYWYEDGQYRDTEKEYIDDEKYFQYLLSVYLDQEFIEMDWVPENSLE